MRTQDKNSSTDREGAWCYRRQKSNLCYGTDKDTALRNRPARRLFANLTAPGGKPFPVAALIQYRQRVVHLDKL